MQGRLSFPQSIQHQAELQSMLSRITIVQIIATGLCDFIAQCILVRIIHYTYHPFYSPKSSKIYRCWIVWGKNIRFVIIPSFLAIAYIGQPLNLSSSDKPIYCYLHKRWHSCEFRQNVHLRGCNFQRPYLHNQPSKSHNFICDRIVLFSSIAPW